MQAPELAKSLADFRIDFGQPALGFARRLAEENRWTPAHAERVMREYFRFVYLAAVSDRPVTPSVAIDQAWHLHLCYTRSYWEELCGKVLGRPLHHGPTRGGKAEAEKYRDWYEHTLSLYEREFGEAPPPDIWPDVGRRFSRKAQPRCVAAERFWILEKARCVRTGMLSLLGMTAALGAGSALQEKQSFLPVYFLGGTGLLLIAIYIIQMIRDAEPPEKKKSTRHRKRGSGDSSCGTVGGCGSWSWFGGNDPDGSDCGGSDCGGDSGCGGGCGGCGGD